MRGATALRIRASFIVSVAAAMLTGFSPPNFAPPAGGGAWPPVLEAKLGLTYLTKSQEQDLWKRADQYALAEAFLKQCATASNIERRMMQAAGPCVETRALLKVAGYFRNKVAQFAKSYKFECGTAKASEQARAARTKIDSDVNEVRSMCQACIIC